MELAVLAVIARAETYGYELTKALRDAGFGAVKGGTLYPLLARLEDAGLIVSRWQVGDPGPGRKYYSLSAAGRAELAARADTWLDFSRQISDLVKEQR